MDQRQRLDWLIHWLRAERQAVIDSPDGFGENRALLRALVNMRPPRPVSEEFLSIQDAFLQQEARQRGIVRIEHIPPIKLGNRISLWQGDITRLKADAIVNAANSAMLGCFVPNHRCIDNAIHSYAGVQLRQSCDALMRAQGHDEPTGSAKITPAFNLPSKHVIHTVGPIVHDSLTQLHRDQLADCYRACLSLATEHSLETIAFCCISTGEFRFPRREAAEIAIHTVKAFLDGNAQIQRVIFNVFADEDFSSYREMLNK